MPYRSKKKRRLYAAKWRKKHPHYMRDYNMAYYHEQPPTCLLGYKRNARAEAPLPEQSRAETQAKLKLPQRREVRPPAPIHELIVD